MPSSLSDVGIDDIDTQAYITPWLTTVHIPIGRVGQMAVATVIWLIRSNLRHSQADLPTPLVVRRSTAIAPGEQ